MGWGSRGFGKPEPAIPVLGQTKSTQGGGKLGIQIQITSEALDIAIGPQSLCDVVTRALTKHHAESIAQGKRPGGGSQEPLDPKGEQGRRAADGNRPKARGNTGKPTSLPETLTRYPIKASGRIVTIGSPPKDVKIGPRRAARIGTQATAVISPALENQAKWIDEEASEGNEFFAVDGLADRVIEDAVIDYMATVFDGVRSFSPEQVKARDIK